MEFPFVFKYDAEKSRFKTLNGLKWLMAHYEVVTPTLAFNYFSTIELAEIIDCFFDLIRDKMDEQAVVFGLPISADALDITSILREDEMSKIVADIIKFLKKQAENEPQKQFA